MESYDFPKKSTNKNVAFKSTQKNYVNMIFECDASRLAIYISLGHHNNIFFLKSQKNQESGNKKKTLYRQEGPDIHFGRFLGPVFATRDLQNDMFR